MNNRKSKENLIDINKIIQKLLSQGQQEQFRLTQAQIFCICHQIKNIMVMQPMLLELNPPINICGDFHGQFDDLKEMFDTIGLPDAGENYLFLGDYVDRGKKSLQCICLLFALKIKFPNRFFLLRGNHQCSELNKIYGFYDQCKRKVGIKIWKVICDCFSCLPVAAIVGSRIFCVHGGLSPYLSDISQINNIKRPFEFNKSHLVSDLLWSDPSSQEGWTQNQQRGTSYCFGPDIIKKFLKKNDFDMICRSHQIVEDGFEFFCNQSLLTIFSAPNYCNMHQNKGAVLVIDEDMCCKIKQFCKTLSYKYKIQRSSTPSGFRLDRSLTKNSKHQRRRTSLGGPNNLTILKIILHNQI